MSKLPFSKGALVALTLAIYLIFLILITYGYWTWIVRPNSPTLSLLVQATLVGLIVVGASIAIRSIALLKAQGAGADKGRRPNRWFFYWLIVALITAVGTISGAFHWIESREILRDDIGLVQGRYDTLAQRAAGDLGENVYRHEQETLRADLNELKGEIDESTGQRCGFGEKAQLALDKINQIVSVQRLSGSVPLNPCDRLRARLMFEPYVGRTWAAFDAKWQGSKSAERRKDEVLRRIEADKSTHHQHLDDLAAAAVGSGSANAIDKGALVRAQSAFNDDLKSYAEFDSAGAKEIGSIGHLQSSDTETYASVPQLIYDRLLNYRTWIYIGIAILIDLLLIGLLAELSRRYARRRVKAANLSEAERVLLLKFEHDPRFLWTAPIPGIAR